MILGWPMTLDNGPSADVAQVDNAERAELGNLANEATMFTVVDGDYAVNATHIDVWTMRPFRKTAGVWKSLRLYANTDACSLVKAGFPADVAGRMAHNFDVRGLDPMTDKKRCFAEHEPVTTSEGPPSAVATIRRLELGEHRRYETDCCMFAIVDGDYAVNSSFLGDGWHERLFRKIDGRWTSLRIDVLTTACSLRSAGVPAAVAQRLDRDFRTRFLDEGGHRTGCWTHPDGLRSTL